MQTHFTASKLLKEVLRIEKQLGRERKSGERYHSRTIDIDILFYNDEVKEGKSLILPHPELHKRKFVLQPLADITTDLIHPKLGKSIQELFSTCEDTSQLDKQPKWLKNPKDVFSLNSHNYIAIEGTIGVGKTSLATMIANEFKAKLILERFKDNPFLPKFYKEPHRYAFPLEMSFLADRYQQLLDDIGQYDLFADFMIADYDRYKSLIFAKVTLPEEEFVLYKRLHEMMYKDIPKPDLYIYLYQSTERLLENIKKRGRSYERSIKAEYLEKINTGYLDFIKSQHHLNVKIIDVSQLDFVKKRKDFIELLKQIV